MQHTWCAYRRCNHGATYILEEDEGAGRTSSTKRTRWLGTHSMIFWITWLPFWSATQLSARPRSSLTSATRRSSSSLLASPSTCEQGLSRV